MLADQVEFVVGVDTHADQHTFCLVEAHSQRTVVFASCPVSRQGYRRALRLARRRAPGRRVWAVEGTGSYGKGLTRYLSGQAERVLEVERPKRSGRAGRLKDDRLDAEQAARAVLAGRAGSRPRLGAWQEPLRALLVTREAAVDVRRRGLNELHALVRGAPEPLAGTLRGLNKDRLLARCLRLRPGRSDELERRTTGRCLRATAERVQQATRQADQLEHELTLIVGQVAPHLLARKGVGPISAGWILIAWAHPNRLHSEAAFARLAGAAPIPASSGKTIRHRLDRGGDRKLNRALHTIALTLRRSDDQTKAYIARRLAEGKTEREALRCIKRYLARSLYRLMETTAQTT
jgi:transposase